jgi:hypothetical protein
MSSALAKPPNFCAAGAESVWRWLMASHTELTNDIAHRIGRVAACGLKSASSGAARARRASPMLRRAAAPNAMASETLTLEIVARTSVRVRATEIEIALLELISARRSARKIPAAPALPPPTPRCHAADASLSSPDCSS